MPSTYLRSLRASVPALLALLAASCVGGDAPTDPSRVPFSPTAQLSVQPQLAETAEQARSTAAAQDAFDLLTCFVLVATRASSGEEAARTTLRVSPGQDRYLLSAQVDLEESPETFRVTITAYASAGGDPCGFELFSGTTSVTVQAGGLSDDDPASEPVPLTLAPSGPQTGAAELRLEPGHAVLSGGGSVQLVPTLLDAGGEVISEGEELAGTLLWESSGSAATVDDGGSVTGSSDGAVEVTAATVAGLSATVPVYVAAGELAYVTGGNLVVGTVDGTRTETVASGASRPAWGPDGRLAYASGGSVVEAGGGTLIPGAGSPTWRPTGTHVTGYAGGLVHATEDGAFVAEEAVQGPANPRWLSATHLVGDGPDGLVRVKADGTERSRLTTSRSDRLPSPGGGGIYFISSRDGGTPGVFRLGGGGSAVRVTPDGFTAGGRPSASGGWILVSGSGELGSGLHLVPASGGRPLPLPLGGAGDPAWRSSGSVTAPGGPEITGLEPERPRGGEEVTLRGTGFDWLVPGANRVEVPVVDGGGAAAPGGQAATGGALAPGDASVEVSVVAVTEEALTFEAPPNLAGGEGRVVTPFGEAGFSLDPASGVLRVVARTETGHGVQGVDVRITSSTGETVAGGATDAEGVALFEGLPVGDYSVEVAPPEGYELETASLSASVLLDETTERSVRAVPLPWTVELSTTSITFGGVGETRSVSVAVRAIDGNPVSAPLSVERIPGSVVTSVVRGSTVELTSIGFGTATVIVSVPEGSSSSAAETSAPSAPSAGSAVTERSLSAEIRVEVPEPDEPPGSLVGNVYDASTGAGIAGATVRVRNQTTGAETTVLTDAEGGYQVESLAPGSYRIDVTAEGFQDGSASATVESGEETTVSPIGLTVEGFGGLEGTVRDAIQTSNTIAGATVELREGSGAPDSDPVVASTTTDASGDYFFQEIASGNYTIRAAAEGFADGHADVVIEPDAVASRDVLLSPELAEGEMRIVLTWGPNLSEVARDLDSHLTGPAPEGSVTHMEAGRFHTYFGDRGSLDSPPFAYLHNDDTSYEGPETTTITQVFDGTYRFIVDLWCCTETIRTSQAKVQVYDADGLVAEFNAPNRDGQTWIVFDIVGGGVQPVNRMEPGRVWDDSDHTLAHPSSAFAAPEADIRLAPGAAGDEEDSLPVKEIRPRELDESLDRFRQEVEREGLPYRIPEGAPAID